MLMIKGPTMKHAKAAKNLVLLLVVSRLKRV